MAPQIVRTANSPPAAPAPSRKVDWTLAYVVIAAAGAVALLAMVTSPVAALLGDSEYAIPSALHGVSATLYVIVSTASLYMAFLLYTGRLEAYRDLRIVAWLQAFLSLVTVLFGNWIYIYYRASTGPRAYLLENSPALHEIFFEFKEFAALFTLPLATAAAFILSRERASIAGNARMRQAVAVVLALAWVFLMLSFTLGAAITKVRSV